LRNIGEVKSLELLESLVREREVTGDSMFLAWMIKQIVITGTG
jgi:hypothetical protein